MTSSAVAAVVPAAGASRRFGSVKLLAAIEGEPLLQRTLRALVDAGVSRVVVVTAPDARLDAITLFGDVRVTRVTNASPERGMFSSIQTGMTSVAQGAAVVVLPADMPFVRPATIAALVDEHRRNPDEVLVASYAGRRGHPIVLPAAVVPRLAALPASMSLKGALEQQGIAPTPVEIDDSGVLRDVDVPADLV
jgi:molybdenum cofactor cytidylyltransferase